MLVAALVGVAHVAMQALLAWLAAWPTLSEADEALLTQISGSSLLTHVVRIGVATFGLLAGILIAARLAEELSRKGVLMCTAAGAMGAGLVFLLCGGSALSERINYWLALLIQAGMGGGLGMAFGLVRWRFNPDRSRVAAATAVRHSAAGRYDRAEQELERALEAHPERYDLWMNRGNVRWASGRRAEAAADFERAIELEPGRHEGHESLGRMHAEGGDFAAALVHLDWAVARMPGRAELHCVRGIALARLGRDDEAWQALTQAVSLNASFAEAYNERGALLIKKGMAAEARADLDRALWIAPQMAAAYVNRANALAQLGDFAPALEDANRALVIEPNRHETLLVRAGLHEAMGNGVLAERDRQAAGIGVRDP